jgi:predicted nucleic acid-binding protein
LNGFERMRQILDYPLHRVYFAAITRKELLAKPRLSSTERRRIELLLLKHRLIPVDENIAKKFSSLLQKYSRQGLRNADALVAATAWSRNLPLFTRNFRHYRFISEITLLDPLKARDRH